MFGEKVVIELKEQKGGFLAALAATLAAGMFCR